jgi:hypothetical protein
MATQEGPKTKASLCKAKACERRLSVQPNTQNLLVDRQCEPLQFEVAYSNKTDQKAIVIQNVLKRLFRVLAPTIRPSRTGRVSKISQVAINRVQAFLRWMTFFHVLMAFVLRWERK